MNESSFCKTKSISDRATDIESYLEILRQLVREPCVVGAEDPFFRILRRELEEVGVSVRYYQGILVAQGSRPHDLLLSAHVDRHGLVCTGPNEFQYSAFIAGNRGELNGDSVSEQMMNTIVSRFAGRKVQAHLPYVGSYLGQGLITSSKVCPRRNNLIFELDGLEFLQPGTPISFLDRLSVSRETLSAQLDNVLSVAILIHLFRQGYQGTALFTAQEEAGRSWRFALDWFRREGITTDRLIVLDTSPFPDIEVAMAQDLVLRKRDATASFAETISRELVDRCMQLGFTYIHKDAYVEAKNVGREKPLSLGRTELGRLIAATNGAISGTTLQLPTTGYHTPEETVAVRSVNSAIELLMSFL